MHVTYPLIAMTGVAVGLPTWVKEARSLINLSPEVSPSTKVGGDNSCFGLGISVCDPINVKGTQGSNNGHDDEHEHEHEQPEPVYPAQPEPTYPGQAQPQPEPTYAAGGHGGQPEKSGEGKAKDVGSLLNVAPDVSPDTQVGGDNSCFGVGISACDPINVKGTQGSNNAKRGVVYGHPAGYGQPPKPEEPHHHGGSLIDASPEVSPDTEVGGDNSCFGVGISACDPINVKGTQGSNNDKRAEAEVAAPVDVEVESRSLINASPEVTPETEVGGDNSCFGLGISVCDPINVKGTQGSNNDKRAEAEVEAPVDVEVEARSLINLSPEVSPETEVGGDNSCFGVGISVCDPINVKGTQGSNNN